MDIVNKIKNYLKKYKLLNKTHHYLIGFSGGADSMLMLYYLNELKNQYGYKLSALHINHDWRGKESEEEAENCRKFCEKYNIDFYCEKLDKKTKKDENSARNARYELFDKYAKKLGITAIFTAHNKTDVIETFIYRLLKGMGIEGALSIPAKRAAKYCDIYRPLLNISSKDIRVQCDKLKLHYNFDSSNLDNKYKRNYIRNEILPKFKEMNSDYEKSVISFIENLKSSYNILENFLKKTYDDTISENKITTAKFLDLDEDLQREIIHKFLIKNNFDPEKELIFRLIKQIKDNCDKPNGKKYSIKLPQTKNKVFFFCSKKESYFVEKVAREEKTVYFDKNFSYPIEIMEYNGQKIPKSHENIVIVNKKNLKFPLEIRYRKNGDIIQPFSHKSKIKLKDYFIKNQIPQHKRDKTLLLCKNDEVLWAIGVGISEKLRANIDCPNDCVVLKYNSEG